MGMMIQGIRINHVNITKNKESGLPEITGSYSLMSESDIALATNSFNNYNDLKLEPSPDTAQALNKLFSGVKADIEKILGIKEN